MNILRIGSIIIALVLFFVSQRTFRVESYYWALTTLSLTSALLGWVLTLVGEKRAKFCSLAWQTTLLLGLSLYLVDEHLITASDTPLAKVILASWLLSITLAIFAGLGAEWSLLTDASDTRRVIRSTTSWLSVGMILSSLVCLNYIGTKRDYTRDWSYLKTTTPSDATIAAINAGEKPLDIAVFYPLNHEIRSLAKPYFDTLANRAPKVQLQFFDKDMDPARAEEFKVTRNGQVVFRVGELRERLDIGTEIATARKVLAKLDGEVQKMILRLTTKKQKIYFTKGHGEFAWSSNEKDERRRIDQIENFLRSQNFSINSLSLVDGSGQDIPEDAGLLMIVGPDQDFLPAEIKALEAYLERGGRIWYFAEIENSSRDTPTVARRQFALDEMFKRMGIEIHRFHVANDKRFTKFANNESDRWFLYTNRFSSHESVSILSRNDERAAFLVNRSGYLSVNPNLGIWRATSTVRSLDGSYIDRNQNAKMDPDEKEENLTFVAAATKPVDVNGEDKEARVIVSADATAITDLLIQNRGNAVFVVDGLRWLTNSTELGGATSNEEDIKIQHSNKENALWFNATIILMPLFILGAGWLMTRRRSLRPSLRSP